MLIDLHTHTAPRSYDALQTPGELVLEAKALGLDAICLTEHDAFWPTSDLQALSRGHNLLLLPGCEINTDEGHFLAFGLTEYVFGMHKLPVLRAHVDRCGGALVAAHPYRRRYRTPGGDFSVPLEQMLHRAAADDAFQRCEALETYNGRGADDENRFSRALAQRLGLPCTAGSDSHQPGDLGACTTQFDQPIHDLDGLIRELKAGRFRPQLIDPSPI